MHFECKITLFGTSEASLQTLGKPTNQRVPYNKELVAQQVPFIAQQVA